MKEEVCYAWIVLFVFLPFRLANRKPGGLLEVRSFELQSGKVNCSRTSRFSKCFKVIFFLCEMVAFEVSWIL